MNAGVNTDGAALAVTESELDAFSANDDLDHAIERARNAVVEAQAAEGYWCYEFEADCTIPSEYILLANYTGDPQFTDGVHPELEARIGRYLRARQDASGGWSQYPGGEFDISCSVKAYYALKLIGDDPDEPHMRTARQAILDFGGAARANVFTRITLALFQQVPWRAVPVVPVELTLLPDWSPFTLSKAAYWTRTVTMPLAILCSRQEKAKNPKGIGIRELFVRPPDEETDYFPVRSRLNQVFIVLDRCTRAIEPFIPGFIRRYATKRAERWFVERLNGLDGLGAIFPAMVNGHEALLSLGYANDHPLVKTSAEALKNLLVIGEDEAYCQPCVSPVWDTGLACLSLVETDAEANQAQMQAGLDWLADRQLTDEPGDWRKARPNLAGGGWPFQFGNDYYPDVDDSAVVAWA
ncbi:MAG: squalene--hopene cyclase, partial [Gammaproteobacteria bacterium]|nr:squalene--hopene cyclase [Gammaproteobacteria bacterium]